MDSWATILSWDRGDGQGHDYNIRDVRARILGDTAWVSMDADLDVNPGSFHVINVYEFYNGRWYMVYHHTSVIHVFNWA